MVDFLEVIRVCELNDLDFSGPRYTWCNKRGDSALISERLDRFMGNKSWCNLYEKASVFHGSIAHFDHLPIWLDVRGVSTKRRRFKLFRFEAMWLGEKDCTEIVKDSWSFSSSNTSLQGVIKSIATYGSKLQQWNKANFGNVDANLKEAQQKLKTEQQRDPNVLSSNEVCLAYENVQGWLKREEIMWRQRLRALWLVEGDQNTKCFLAKATQRKKKNSIMKLMDDDGCWHEGEECDSLILNHFSSLFTSAGTRDEVVILNKIERKVSVAMNEDLIKEFT